MYSMAGMVCKDEWKRGRDRQVWREGRHEGKVRVREGGRREGKEEEIDR